MNTENPAKRRASSQDNNQKLDDICERLEFLEAISELFHLWEQVTGYESDELLSAKSMGIIGKFFHIELIEIRGIIACEIMDRPSAPVVRKEVSK